MTFFLVAAAKKKKRKDGPFFLINIDLYVPPSHAKRTLPIHK